MILAALLLVPAVLADPFLWDPNCGHSPYEDAGNTSTTIVGGWPAREHEFPWMVSLRYVGGGHTCGGFLVTPNHVITAAHCSGGLEVVAGEHLRNETGSEYRQVIGVKETIRHPNYSSSNFANDAAVLVLNGSVIISDYVGTICAPEAGDDHVNINAVVSGWGAYWSGSPGTNELRYYIGPILSNEDCLECVNGVTPDMVCQGACGDNAGDSCQGDSGGPLFYEDSNTDLWTIIGIVSWGYGCAAATPGVYSRITTNLDWFTEVIRNSSLIL